RRGGLFRCCWWRRRWRWCWRCSSIRLVIPSFPLSPGEPSLDNFIKTFDLYTTDIVFTLVIVAVSTALTGLLAAAIGGYLVLGAHPAAVTLLKWLYRWPLFIPFIVAAQCMRTFLAKNGMLNNTLDTLVLVDVTI